MLTYLYHMSMHGYSNRKQQQGSSVITTTVCTVTATANWLPYYIYTFSHIQSSACNPHVSQSWKAVSSLKTVTPQALDFWWCSHGARTRLSPWPAFYPCMPTAITPGTTWAHTTGRPPLCAQGGVRCQAQAACWTQPWQVKAGTWVLLATAHFDDYLGDSIFPLEK